MLLQSLEKRRGFSPKTVTALRDFFKIFVRGNGLFASRLDEVREKFTGEAVFDMLFNFIDNAGRNGICQSYKR